MFGSSQIYIFTDRYINIKYINNKIIIKLYEYKINI